MGHIHIGILFDCQKSFKSGYLCFEGKKIHGKENGNHSKEGFV